MGSHLSVDSRDSLWSARVGENIAVKLSRTIAAGAAAMLLLIGGCSEADVATPAPETTSAEATAEPVPEATMPAPTPEPEAPAPTPEAEATPEPAPAPAALSFDESMVRSYEVNKEHKGGQANAAIVAESTDLEVLKSVGLGCIDHYLQEQKAAFCQVWGSEADYESRDPQGVGDLFCWVYYMGVPLNGGEPTIMDAGPVDYTVSACPGGVRPYV